jgi:hypothetical protein
VSIVVKPNSEFVIVASVSWDPVLNRDANISLECQYNITSAYATLVPSEFSFTNLSYFRYRSVIHQRTDTEVPSLVVGLSVVVQPLRSSFIQFYIESLYLIEPSPLDMKSVLLVASLLIPNLVASVVLLWPPFKNREVIEDNSLEE